MAYMVHVQQVVAMIIIILMFLICQGYLDVWESKMLHLKITSLHSSCVTA